MPAPHCAAIGCRARILPTELFCQRHLTMLQSDIRTLVLRTFRPGQTPTKVFTRHLERAQLEILYAQTEGHRVPRPAEFEW
jgi:hypothetical protein